MADAKGGLVILHVSARDFMRVRVAEMRFASDGVQLIKGPNGSGKSSLLAGIESILLGLSHSSARPINDAAETASFKVVLAGHDDAGNERLLSVEADWRRDGDKTKRRLRVTENGSPVPGEVQKRLTALFSGIRFDFAGLVDGASAADKRERLDLLMGTMPALVSQIGDLDSAYAQVYEERTQTGRDVTRLSGALASMPVPAASIPEEPVDACALSKRLAEIRDTQAELADLQRRNDADQAAVQRIDGEIAEAERRIASLKAKKVELSAAIELRRDAIASAPEGLDAAQADLEKRLQDASETNAAIEKARRYRETQAALDAARATYDALAATLQGIQSLRDGAIRDAKYPMPDLRPGDDDVTIGDREWSVAATSQRIRALLAIGMAQRPRLRALFVPNGNAFDSTTLRIIDEEARANHFQILMEYVALSADTEGEFPGFYIEDGEIGHDCQ
jgi:predicted  nucleic acid-binding Zn-ribbon protein